MTFERRDFYEFSFFSQTIFISIYVLGIVFFLATLLFPEKLTLFYERVFIRVGALRHSTFRWPSFLVIVVIIGLYVVKGILILPRYLEVFDLPVRITLVIAPLTVALLMLRPQWKMAAIPLIVLIFWLQIPDYPYYTIPHHKSLREQINELFVAPKTKWGEHVFREVMPFRLFDIDGRTRSNIWSPQEKIDIAFEPPFDPNTPRYLALYESLFMVNLGDSANVNMDSHLVDLYNVKYLRINEYQGKKYKPTGAPNIYRNEFVFPRFYLTYEGNSFKNENELFITLNSSNYEQLRKRTLILENEWLAFQTFKYEALSDDPLPIKDDLSFLPLNAEKEQIEILYRGTNRVTLGVNLLKEGLLNASELWFPAWRVWVDGAEKPLLRGNGVFWCVPVLKGPHVVHFIFDDRISKISGWITLLSLVGFISLIVFGIWYRKISQRWQQV